jgi:hypothetical protein
MTTERDEIRCDRCEQSLGAHEYNRRTGNIRCPQPRKTP